MSWGRRKTDGCCYRYTFLYIAFICTLIFLTLVLDR